MLNSILNFVLGSMPNIPDEPKALTHAAWARQQLPISNAIRAMARADLNPAVHRCRIGKINLKRAS